MPIHPRSSSGGLLDRPGVVEALPAQSPVVTVRNLTKRYRIYHSRSFSLKQRLVGALRRHGDQYEEFLALKDVTMDVPAGQVLGILGGNGSGKSTLLKILARVVEPDGGEARVNGRLSAILELGAGFHPELTGRRNIHLYGSLLGLGRRDIQARMPEIIQFAELERFIDTPIRHYSSGMVVRLAFSVAAHVDADVLLLDEVLAVGDASFREKCLAHTRRLKAEGKTILLVSHSMPEIQALCDRAILLAQGGVALDGDPSTVVAAYEAMTSS